MGRHHNKSSGHAGCGTEDLSVHAGTPKLATLRSLLAVAAIHGNPVAFGDCHSAFHRSPMPSESEPVYVEPVLEAQVDSSKVWLRNKALQGLKISPRAWGIQSTDKINVMGFDQLVLEP